MKAAVIYSKGGMPLYTDIPEPKANHSDEILVTVRAVSIKHLDKSKASGKHYSSETSTTKGRVIGGDGVCLLPGGTRVYGMGVDGTLSEKALIDKHRIVHLPEGVPDSVAAALANAVIGSAMALKFKGVIQPGEVVLINGATGFTGRVAVQIAKHYGAGKVIATGRNPQSLQDLLKIGADEIFSTEDADFQARIKAMHGQSPIDVIIDYLWGPTAEILLSSLMGDGSFTHRTRFVSVGSMTGDGIRLSAANLRSVDLQLTGSGLGSWNKAQVRQLFSEILPEMFQLAAEGKLKVETLDVKLENIAALWDMNIPSGQRLVVTIG